MSPLRGVLTTVLGWMNVVGVGIALILMVVCLLDREWLLALSQLGFAGFYTVVALLCLHPKSRAWMDQHFGKR